MNIALRRPMTVADYLAWSEENEHGRTELINGRIVAMTPERVEHVEIKFAVTLAFKIAISRARRPCHALGDGIAIRIDDHTAYEPDASVYCGEKLARGSLVLPNPTIVVEVLSPATAHNDTSGKLIGYFKIPTVEHYLIIDPDRRAVTHYSRVTLREAPRVLTTGSLRLDPPGIEVDVDDFFA